MSTKERNQPDESPCTVATKAGQETYMARYQPAVTQFEFDPKDGRTNGGRLHNTRLAQLLWDMG